MLLRGKPDAPSGAFLLANYNLIFDNRNMNNTKSCLLEVCCASVQDCINASGAGADRIELNTAYELGGLSVDRPFFLMAREALLRPIPLICMVRPRPGGFFYSPKEKNLMFAQAKELLEAGADGIAFGFLNKDRTVDEESTRQMCKLTHKYPGRQAVFHRAFDLVPKPMDAAGQLAALGVDRILTSGQKETAEEGISLLKRLQKKYKYDIEIMPGCGLSVHNVLDLVKETGVEQVHASLRSYRPDFASETRNITFAVDEFMDTPAYGSTDPETVSLTRQMLDLLDLFPEEKGRK